MPSPSPHRHRARRWRDQTHRKIISSAEDPSTSDRPCSSKSARSAHQPRRTMTEKRQSRAPFPRIRPRAAAATMHQRQRQHQTRGKLHRQSRNTSSAYVPSTTPKYPPYANLRRLLRPSQECSDIYGRHCSSSPPGRWDTFT